MRKNLPTDIHEGSILLYSDSFYKVLEETENKLKIRFSHEETTIMKVMDKISEYCTIEDIHMKEAELEDILKEIYKGVHKC